MSYDMREQLDLSRLRDSEIDKHFSDKWGIEPVGRLFERIGVDRIWTHKMTGRRWSVEYKHDTLAHKTGNVFVETTSVDTADVKGWAYTSCAQVLVYYVVSGEYAFVIRMAEIERRLAVWEQFYETKSASTLNKGTGKTYKTYGVCVPLLIFRAAADKVVPVYSGDERTAATDNVIPLLVGSGVLG